MTTVADVTLDGKARTYEGRELTTFDVIECAKTLEQQAIEAFVARPRTTEGLVRSWLASNRNGSDTTRQEFEEAVRRYLMTRWSIR